MDDHPIAGPNALHPDEMSAEERIEELGQILAAGLIRLHRKRGPGAWRTPEPSACPLTRPHPAAQARA